MAACRFLCQICRKKNDTAFDRRRLSSEGGMLLLRGVEQRLRFAERLAAFVVDRLDPSPIDHGIIDAAAEDVLDPGGIQGRGRLR
jgi:hypothetical protein